ncbi:hypothetical protein DLAC_06471 [Tieghemostelium lacteum]|uniref:Uncharacterized protein n=1 Tax=Tieghemostelium lacteum TaxID=361077 RepID=A0A151ZEU5_TIELA|nr:hypothetical protein DLAC_06471 [Tieghemostelium lacteum]|eukprot:KYQ92488.1 hypothetical protein DLAC_06471 [Tieghemostelium lacteum]
MIENNNSNNVLECEKNNHIKKITGYCTECCQVICYSCVTKPCNCKSPNTNSSQSHIVIDVDEVVGPIFNRFNAKKETNQIKLNYDHNYEKMTFKSLSPKLVTSNLKKTVTFKPDQNYDINVSFTEQSYDSGIHCLRLKIDKINRDSKWIFLGVTNKLNSVEPIRFGADKNYCTGISSFAESSDDLKPTGNLKRDWVDGDIFSLILNCDEGTLKILKERTGEFELRTNVEKNTTTHFVVELYAPSNAVTILN